MTDKIYTLTELQSTPQINQPIKIEYYDRTNELGDYEILRITGDTLAVSIYVAEKINTRFQRNELNQRMKAFIESEDLREIPSKGKSKSI